MKNFKKLSKNEMRKVTGGWFECGTGFCPNGTECGTDGTCIGEGHEDGPPKTTKCRCWNGVSSPAVDTGKLCTDTSNPTCESLGYSCSLGSLITECN